jgi:hypothetical protein
VQDSHFHHFLWILFLTGVLCTFAVEKHIPQDILQRFFAETKDWVSIVGGWIVLKARGCRLCEPKAREISITPSYASKLATLKIMSLDELLVAKVVCEAHLFSDLRSSVLSKLCRGRFYREGELREMGYTCTGRQWHQACQGYEDSIKVLESDGVWIISVKDTYFLLPF